MIISSAVLFNFVTAATSQGQLSQPFQDKQQQSSADNFRTYKETANGTSISIQAPSNWIVGSPVYSKHIMVIDSPEVNSYGKHIAEIRVGVDSSPLTLNMTDYLDNEISVYQNNPDFGNFQLVYSTANTHLSGHPALFLGTAYTDSSTGIRYGAFEIGSFFNDNKFYFVYAAVDADQIVNYYPLLLRMLGSFQVTSPGVSSSSVEGNVQGQTISPQGIQENTVVIPRGAAANQTPQYFQPSIAQITTYGPTVTITWINQDSVTHTATAENGLFDTAGIAPSTSSAVVLSNQQQVQGEITYRCNFHPFMTGTLQFSSATSY